MTILDDKCQTVGVYNHKLGYELQSKAYYLNNGNIIFEYYDYLPFDAEEYELFEHSSYGIGTKANIFYEMFNVTDGTTKEVDFEKYILSSWDKDQIESVGMKYSEEYSVLVVCDIENKQICDDKYEMVVVDNDLNIVAKASDSKEGAVAVTLWADDTYAYMTSNGYMYIEKADGTSVKSLYSSVAYSFNENEKFLWDDEVIYSKADFTKVYDLKTNNQTILYSGDDYFIFKKDVKNGDKPGITYTRFNGSATSTILTTLENTDAKAKMFIGYYESIGLYGVCTKEVKEDDDGDVVTYKYEYYNSLGNVIISYTSELSSMNTINIVGATDDAAIIYYLNNGSERVYCRLA